MRFNLVDQIVELVPGQRIHAVKNLTLGEEYLADHFPMFPVMPGVLMLETLVQAAGWLIRVSDGFTHNVVVLREAKGIKYGSFVEPGRQLNLAVEMAEKNGQDSGYVSLKGKGDVGGVTTVTGRFVVEKRRLQDLNPELAAIDEQLAAHYRGLYQVLKRNPVS